MFFCVSILVKCLLFFIVVVVMFLRISFVSNSLDFINYFSSILTLQINCCRLSSNFEYSMEFAVYILAPHWLHESMLYFPQYGNIDSCLNFWFGFFCDSYATSFFFVPHFGFYLHSDIIIFIILESLCCM